METSEETFLIQEAARNLSPKQWVAVFTQRRRRLQSSDPDELTVDAHARRFREYGYSPATAVAMAQLVMGTLDVQKYYDGAADETLGDTDADETLPTSNQERFVDPYGLPTDDDSPGVLSGTIIW